MGTEVQIRPNNKKKRRLSVCVGCGSQINDQYILRVAPDLEWHASCLKCADCDQFLDETCTCFVRDGKTYCKRDYVRLFGTKCAKCGQGFSKNDFVMRACAKVYHIDCFRCVACSRQLIPGDEFALRDDGLFCKADHDVVDKLSIPSEDSKSTLDDSKDSIRLSNNNNNNNNNKNDSKKTTTQHITGHLEPLQNNSSLNSQTNIIKTSKGGGRSGGRSHKSDQKTTRIRTVLNEKQLHTLRTCYGANPRPDALMKEQLTEMTGLSSRVIRVWFQNKRCKDKKRNILLKQMAQQQQDKGVPMVASSPVRHEPPQSMQPTPVEVQSYQPPWKALSEFAAMQGDLDQPPFQQLVCAFENHGMAMHNGMTYAMPTDEFCPPPSSVSSDTLPRSPSELSSPMSQ